MGIQRKPPFWRGTAPKTPSDEGSTPDPVHDPMSLCAYAKLGLWYGLWRGSDRHCERMIKIISAQSNKETDIRYIIRFALQAKFENKVSATQNFQNTLYIFLKQEIPAIKILHTSIHDLIKLNRNNYKNPLNSFWCTRNVLPKHQHNSKNWLQV